MFSEIFSCIKAALEHLGHEFSKLIRCKCKCCNKTTYYNCRCHHINHMCGTFVRKLTPSVENLVCNDN